MSTNPTTPDQDETLDTALFICATYGTPILGTGDQEPYIEGFKHSRTYREAKAALNAHYLAKALAAMPEKITRNRYHPDTLAFGPETARIGGFNIGIDQYAANLRRVFGEGDYAE